MSLVPLATVVPVKKQELSTSEVAERVTVAGLVGSGLFMIVQKATEKPEVMAVIMGSVAMLPAVGQAIIVLGALIAVGVYAAKMIKEQFSKYLKLLRTIDEFTILLHKIQKISNLTIFISTTYNFDINIDEVIEQMKIIFSRFDEVLKLEKDNYNKIESQVMNPLTAAPDIENEAQQAIARSSELEIKSGAPGNELPNGSQTGGGGGGSQTGGAPMWWERFKFNVHEWNKQLNNDIVKLNIHLTTTMSEFSIILNVIQMNMVVNGLGPNPQEKTKAIAELTKKNYVIKTSSEYRKTRIGILVHDILKLRVDFVYCKARSGKLSLSSNPDDPICKEHIDTYNTGKSFTNYRSSLQTMIEHLIIRLKDGDYDDVTKKSICDGVLIPYANMLTNAKLKGPTDKKEILDAFQLTSLTPEQIAKINTKLDEFVAGIPNDISALSSTAGATSTVMVGGDGFFSNPFKSKTNTPPAPAAAASSGSGGGWSSESAADWEARKKRESALTKSVNLLIASPYNLVSDNELELFLRNIYDFSKKVSQTSPDEIKKALEIAEKMLAPPPPPKLVRRIKKVASETLTQITNALPPGVVAGLDTAKAAVTDGAVKMKKRASAGLTQITNALPPDTAVKIDAAKVAAAAAVDTAKQKATENFDAAKVAAAAAAEKAKQGASGLFSGVKGFFGKGGSGGGSGGTRRTRKKLRFVKHRSRTYKVRL